jgi:hypothetical protein
MPRFLIILLFLLLATVEVWAQPVLTIQNPSFEENLPPLSICVDKNNKKVPKSTKWNCPWSADGSNKFKDFPRKLGDPGIFGMKKIDPWKQCSGTPDLLPNAAGLRPNIMASDGDWYVGLVCDKDNIEAFGQPLSAPFTKGVNYSFQVDLAHTVGGYAPGNKWQLDQPGVLKIYGGKNSCDATGQLLWQSPPIDHADWQTYEITFTPTSAWTHIQMTTAGKNQAGCETFKGTLLLDNIGGFVPGGLKVTSPVSSTSMPCSQVIEGEAGEDIATVSVSGTFDGGTVSASVLPGLRKWNVLVDYLNQTPRNENLKVIATYVDKNVKTDTIMVTVKMEEVVSEFGYTLSDVNSPVKFKDLSPAMDEANKIDYLWDFGDGTTSKNINPKHKFPSDGFYNIKQTITYNDKCKEFVEKRIYVPKEKGNVKITSHKSGDKINECSMKITGTTNYLPESIEIGGDIPAGTVQANIIDDTNWEAEIIFTGTSSGDKKITAKAIYAANVANEDLEFTLDVNGDFKAEFSPLDGQTNYDEKIFTNTSTAGSGKIGSYKWQFGSEGTSVSKDTTWTFQNFGKHKVLMQVIPEDANACGDIARADFEIIPPVISTDGSGFLDSDLDGKMDQIVLELEDDASLPLLNMLNLKFKWYNADDSLVEVAANTWSPDPNNPKKIIWNAPDSLSLKEMSTAVLPDYGTPFLSLGYSDSNGVIGEEILNVPLKDNMAPLISSAVLYQAVNLGEPDTLVVNFSEVLDVENIPEQKLFEFIIASDPSNVNILEYADFDDFRRAGWGSNGKKVSLYFNGYQKNVFPGDSIRINPAVGFIEDLEGNIGSSQAAFVGIVGVLANKAETNVFVVAGIDSIGFKEQEVFGELLFFDQAIKLEDATKGQLGVYFTLVIPSKRGKDKAGETIRVYPEPEDISWEYQVDYFTNIGGFVAHADGIIKCTDEVFESKDGTGNCLSSTIRRFFIPWNYRDENKGLIGSGVYIQRAKINGKDFDPVLIGYKRVK